MPCPSMLFPHMTSSPGPRTDDPPSVWILRRDKLHQGSGLVRLRRITQRKSILKTALDQTGFLRLKSQFFSQFTAKFRLDNKAALRYLNPSCLYHNENCRWVSGSTTYWASTGYRTQPRIRPYFDIKKGILINLFPRRRLSSVPSEHSMPISQ